MKKEAVGGKLVIIKIFLLSLVLAAWVSESPAATHQAAGCTQAQVQAAVNAAADGDTVTIPNGSCTWTGGISTTKQIIIRALNYTPTPAGTAGSGATSRSVTITNNSASALFSFTSGNSYHVGVGGIRFNEGTGGGQAIVFSGSGTKVPFIFDCYFQVKIRSWPDSQVLAIASQGAVIWNSVFMGTFNIEMVGEGSLLIKGSPRVWTTAPTMGAADSAGNVNIYMEACTATNVGQFPDIDDHGRFVARYSIFDGTWGLTHGFTSTWGGRHFEYYNNIFRQTTVKRNLAERYFWLRAGHGVFTDNQVNLQVDPGYYGYNYQLDIGDNTSPGTYPQNRQPGWGHNGTAYAIDPIYIWNQTGERAYAWGVDSVWASAVQLNREIYVNSGAKPGYSKYTYPHPLRSVIEGGGGDTTPPVITITSPTSGTTYTSVSPTITLAGTASDAVGVTSVTYSNNRGGSGSCTGTTTWTCSGITLYAWDNVITVTAYDAATNSGTDAITVTYGATVQGLTISGGQIR